MRAKEKKKRASRRPTETAHSTLFDVIAITADRWSICRRRTSTFAKWTSSLLAPRTPWSGSQHTTSSSPLLLSTRPRRLPARKPVRQSKAWGGDAARETCHADPLSNRSADAAFEELSHDLGQRIQALYDRHRHVIYQEAQRSTSTSEVVLINRLWTRDMESKTDSDRSLAAKFRQRLDKSGLSPSVLSFTSSLCDWCVQLITPSPVLSFNRPRVQAYAPADPARGGDAGAAAEGGDCCAPCR